MCYMKKMLYVCSDIHGHYTELIKALNEKGFDENNDSHLLVVLGDCFDRGRENVEVYEYLSRLTEENKCIVIKGNHDIMLEKYLSGVSTNPFNYIHNGTNETLADFLHQTMPFETYCILNDEIQTIDVFTKWIETAREEIKKEYPRLMTFLHSMQYYYETKNYIFTHGAIDTKAIDWHKPCCEISHYQDWDALTWDDGSFFGREINNTDKTIVIGHFGTDDLRKMYNLPYGKQPYGILTREDGKVIAIDTCTIVTRKINVLVIEDELMEV